MINAKAAVQLYRLRSELEGMGARWPTAPSIGSDLLGRLARRVVTEVQPKRGSSHASAAAGLGLASLAGLAATFRQQPHSHHRPTQRDTANAATPYRLLAVILRKLLFGFVLPLSLTAGIAGWLRYRRGGFGSVS